MRIYDAANVDCLGRDVRYASNEARKNNCTHMTFNGHLLNVCEHEKQYDDNTAFLSSPPKYKWTCKKCGATGVDIKSL